MMLSHSGGLVILDLHSSSQRGYLLQCHVRQVRMDPSGDILVVLWARRVALGALVQNSFLVDFFSLGYLNLKPSEGRPVVIDFQNRLFPSHRTQTKMKERLGHFLCALGGQCFFLSTISPESLGISLL